MVKAKIRSRRYRHMSARPSGELTIREKVIHEIITDLYVPHWKFWNKKLTELITKNKDMHGRNGDANEYALYYAGKIWFVPWMVLVDASQFFSLQLHESDPDMEKDAVKITANLSELDIETYEVKRFLAGLLSFPAPIDVMEPLLGSALFNRVSKYLKRLTAENRMHLWNPAQIKSFETYAEEHDYLIDAMCQRVMMNLIARDAFAQR